MNVIPAFEIPRVSTTLLKSFGDMANLLFPEFVQFLVKSSNLGQQNIHLAKYGTVLWKWARNS
jgi:hypothetical protein